VKATIRVQIEANTREAVMEGFRRLAFAPVGLNVTTEQPQVHKRGQVYIGTRHITTTPKEGNNGN